MKKQNVKMSEMAKVITLKINMDGEDVYTIISAVSLDMTPEQMIDMRMFPDAKVSVEESIPAVADIAFRVIVDLVLVGQA